MTLGELIQETRERLDDIAEPFLWSKEKLTQYLNEAEREAAERARLLYDQTSSLTTFNTVVGQNAYPLNPLALGVHRVKVGDRVLQRAQREDLDMISRRWEEMDGEPRRFFELEDGRELTLYPRPVTVEPVQLALWRYPLELMADEDDEPEIPERWHFDLTHWAVHLAFLKRDADTDDRTRAERAEARFTQAFGIRRDANVQRKQRPRRAPCVTPSW